MATAISVRQTEIHCYPECLLCVFPTHKEEWAHNKSRSLEFNKSFAVAQVKAVSKGPQK